MIANLENEEYLNNLVEEPTLNLRKFNVGCDSTRLRTCPSSYLSPRAHQDSAIGWTCCDAGRPRAITGLSVPAPAAETGADPGDLASGGRRYGDESSSLSGLCMVAIVLARLSSRAPRDFTGDETLSEKSCSRLQITTTQSLRPQPMGATLSGGLIMSISASNSWYPTSTSPHARTRAPSCQNESSTIGSWSPPPSVALVPRACAAATS